MTIIRVKVLYRCDGTSLTVKADFLSSQKPLAASKQVLASSQNNFLSSQKYDNLMNIGLDGLQTEEAKIKLLRSLYDLLNMPIFP